MRKFSGLLGVAMLLVCAAPHAAVLPEFTQPNAIWNEDVSTAHTRTNSGLMMQHLETLAATEHPTETGKYWGDNRHNQDFQIDFSIYVLHATNATPVAPMVAFPDAGSYYSPDCEDPASSFRFPIVPGGGIEGTDPPAYTCDTNNYDCHLLTVNDTTHVLYESYFTDSASVSGVHSICGLSWDLKKVYPRYGRGEHCTSADGAGFPLAPLLFNPDDVYAAIHGTGDLGHAIRFAIGNERMMAGKHVHPASHGTSATSDTSADAVPYGSRLRLQGGFNVSGFSSSPGVQVILRTLQKYGMVLSDGGSIPLMGETDYFTTHSWADADIAIDSHSFFGINPTNFDVIDAGPPISNSGECARTPTDFLFIDGFDW